MKVVDITPEMRSRAKSKSNRHGDINNSILRGKGNFAGYLGEELVTAEVEGCREHNTFKHDIMMDRDGELVRVEVKTKRRTVEPQGHYTCHIAATSKHQDPDVYVFCSIKIKRDHPLEGWILGWLSREEFYDKARFVNAGDRDEDGFKQHVDAYVVRIDELNPIDQL